MTIAVANISTSTDTFGQWVTKTNIIADALSNKVITTNSNTATGNAAVSNAFTANVLYANTISGGNTGTTTVLTMTSNVDFSANATFKGVRVNLGLPANVAIQGGNSTFRVLTVNSAASNTLVVGQLAITDISDFNITSPANGQFLVYNSTSSKWENTNSANSFSTVDFTASNTITIGNSSVNTIANSTSLLVATGNFGNSTVKTIANGTAIYMGNSVTNTTITSSLITVNNISFSSNGALTLPAGNNDTRPASASNGMIRYNTANNSFEGYANGSWGAIGGSSSGANGNISEKRQSYIANNSVNTTFTVTGNYVTNQADVYQNGIKLVNGTDVDVSSGTTFTLTTAAAIDDTIDFVGYEAGVSNATSVAYTVTANSINGYNNFVVPGGFSNTNVQVYVNGLKVRNGTDVDVSDNQTLAFPSTLSGGTIVEATGYQSYTPADVLANSGDSATGDYIFSGNVTTNNSTTGVLNVGDNLIFTATGKRITGDFTNATVANRVLFQTSTTNGVTSVSVIPNGTAANSGYAVFNNSDPTNAAYGGLNIVGSTDVRIQSAITGTGTYLPMTLYTNGSERIRIDTGGNTGIGTASPAAKLDVNGTLNVSGTTTLATNTFTVGTAAYFTAGGNTGIGTASPAAKLDVNGTLNVSGATTFTGGSIVVTTAGRGTPYAQTYNSSVALDLSQRNHFEMTLTGGVTLANPTNINAGQSGIIKILQDGTGGRTIAFGSYWKFPSGTVPTLTTTANALDALAYYVTNSTYIATQFIADVK